MYTLKFLQRYFTKNQVPVSAIHNLTMCTLHTNSHSTHNFTFVGADRPTHEIPQILSNMNVYLVESGLRSLLMDTKIPRGACPLKLGCGLEDACKSYESVAFGSRTPSLGFTPVQPRPITLNVDVGSTGMYQTLPPYRHWEMCKGKRS